MNQSSEKNQNKEYKARPQAFKHDDESTKIKARLGGRPKGSKNKLNAAILEGRSDEVRDILNKTYELAMAGDTIAIRIFLEKFLPNAKERQIQIDIPQIKSLDDVEPAHDKLIEHLNNGDITLSEADSILNQIEWRRKLYETMTLKKLEEQAMLTAAELEKYKGK